MSLWRFPTKQALFLENVVWDNARIYEQHTRRLRKIYVNLKFFVFRWWGGRQYFLPLCNVIVISFTTSSMKSLVGCIQLSSINEFFCNTVNSLWKVRRSFCGQLLKRRFQPNENTTDVRDTYPLIQFVNIYNKSWGNQKSFVTL